MKKLPTIKQQKDGTKFKFSKRSKVIWKLHRKNPKQKTATLTAEESGVTRDFDINKTIILL